MRRHPKGLRYTIICTILVVLAPVVRAIALRSCRSFRLDNKSLPRLLVNCVDINAPPSSFDPVHVEIIGFEPPCDEFADFIFTDWEFMGI